MNDITIDKSIGTGPVLSRYAEASPSEPAKRPPGTYICLECGDTRIVWRTPVDEYKTKCPKCGVQMTRVKQPLAV